MAFGIFCLWTVIGLFIFDKVVDQTPGDTQFGLKWCLFALACGPLAWIFGGLIFFMQTYEWIEEWWDDSNITDHFKTFPKKLSK